MNKQELMQGLEMEDAERVKSIFLAAIEKASVEERLSFLDETCGADAVLRQRVNALLTAHEGADALLDQCAFDHLSKGNFGSTPDSRQQIQEAELLGFLTPSEQPGLLGRLGHYNILQIVGRGAMGIVLRAFDERLHRIVAIKALAPLLANDAAARVRFVREARAAAAVSHENVVAIHTVEDAGPVPYFVMQFVDGQTLQQKLDASGPLELAQILRIGLQTAEGLAAAHRQGLIHRDIKPSNILLENGVERVKISDFGLARAGDDASVTQPGAVAGTPLYMSPEQARGDPVDHRSDLFSLGSVLYALCTGYAPFAAGSSVGVLKRVCEDTPRSLRELNPEIPAWLEKIVMHLLAKSPADRYASAWEVATVLSARLAQFQAGAADYESDHQAPEPRDPERTPSRGFRRWALGGLMLGGCVVTVYVLWTLKVGERVHQPDPGQARGGQRAVSPWAPAAPPTAEELARRPNPLDGRGRRDIPEELLSLVGGEQEGAPCELVAVLPEKLITDVAISSDGRYLAAGGNDSIVRLWDLGQWKAGDISPPCRLLRGHANRVWSVAFSPREPLLASGSFDGTIILWSATDGRKVCDLSGHSRQHAVLTFSPDGRSIAAGDADGCVNRWDVATGQRQEPFRLHAGVVRAAAYSPSGQLLATAGDDGTVQVVESQTGRQHQLFRGATKRTNVAFSPDGTLVAATCDLPGPSVRVWHVESGVERWAASGHVSHVGGLAFHPLGGLIATGSWDGTARIWDLAARSSTRIALWLGNASERVSVAWSPDGRYLAASREGQGICIFRIPVPASP